MFSDLDAEWNVPNKSAILEKQLFRAQKKKVKNSMSALETDVKNSSTIVSNTPVTPMMVKSFEQLEGDELKIKKRQRKKRNKKSKSDGKPVIQSLIDDPEKKLEDSSQKGKKKLKPQKRKLEGDNDDAFVNPAKKLKVDAIAGISNADKKAKMKVHGDQGAKEPSMKQPNHASIADKDGKIISRKTLRYREKKRRRRERKRAVNLMQEKVENPAVDLLDAKETKQPSVLQKADFKTVMEQNVEKKKNKKRKKCGDNTVDMKTQQSTEDNEIMSESSQMINKTKKFDVAALRKVLGKKNAADSSAATSARSSKVTKSKNSDSNHGSLRGRMEDKLSAARFRFLNEKLYTSTGAEAYRLFHEDPSSYQVYHQGYNHQVEKWPCNPCDVIIDMIEKMPASAVIADFGCGEAKIARTVPNKVHSFDLKATVRGVVECNIAKVPLPPSSVDVAVYCLSLMGTDLVNYLAEGSRVLKVGGILLIAEVKSRFSDVKYFIKGVEKLGFRLQFKDVSNTMFILMKFTKTANRDSSKPLPSIELTPCVYKKR